MTTTDGDLTTAAAADDRLAGLRALRDSLAVRLDGCTSDRDYAALSQRFMDALKQIDDITGGAKQAESPADEIARRRAARRVVTS